MPKQVRYDKNVILNLALKQVQVLRFQNPILKFDIHLTFGPALAGLTFGFNFYRAPDSSFSSSSLKVATGGTSF